MRKKSLVIAIIFALIDYLIKLIIKKSFLLGEINTLIPKVLYLTNVRNTGAAWSIFENNTIFIIIISILVFAFLLFWEKDFQENNRNMFGFSLIYGGLLGNLFDRIMYKYVTDYIGIYIGSYSFPIFNFADILLVIGFAFIIYAVIKKEDKNENSKR